MKRWTGLILLIATGCMPLDDFAYEDNIPHTAPPFASQPAPNRCDPVVQTTAQTAEPELRSR